MVRVRSFHCTPPKVGVTAESRACHRQKHAVELSKDGRSQVAEGPLGPGVGFEPLWRILEFR